jgi:hypothetical protein
LWWGTERLAGFFVQRELINEFAMGSCRRGAEVEDPDDLSQLEKRDSKLTLVTHSDDGKQNVTGSSSFHSALGLID